MCAVFTVPLIVTFLSVTPWGISRTMARDDLRLPPPRRLTKKLHSLYYTRYVGSF